MRKLLLLVGILVPAMVFSQSNDQGTIQLGLGWDVALGGTTVKSTYDTLGEFKGSGVGAKASYGVRFQYGLNEKISAGAYIRKEAAVYATTYDNYDYYSGYGGSNDITTSGLGLGVEAKFYVVNKDHFNLYFGPQIGFYTGKATIDAYSADGGLSGLNYALGGGLNWYWGDHIGMTVDFGYTGQSLSGEPDNLADFGYDTPITKYKVSGGNVYFGVGFIAKFGGQ